MGCCCCMGLDTTDSILIFTAESLHKSSLGEKQINYDGVEMVLYSDGILYDHCTYCNSRCCGCGIDEIKFSHINSLHIRSGDMIISTIDGRRVVFGPNKEEINSLIQSAFNEYTPFIKD